MKLATLVRTDLQRSKGRLAVVVAAVAASVGVVVLLGSIVLGLYRGVVEPLLPRLPLDLLKVEQRSVSVGLLAFDATKLTGGLNDRAIERLEGIEGISRVFPVVGAGIPMRAEGGEGFLGRRLRTDVFATGVHPDLVKTDVGDDYVFAHPEPGKPVPVIVARRLLELYNSTVANAIDKPRLSETAVLGFEFDLVVGASYARGTPDPSKVMRMTARIVGLSDQATLVGVTLPEETVRRWNRRFGVKDKLSGAYVKTRSPADAGPVAQAVEEAGLKVDDTPKIVGAALTVVGALVSLFASVLLILSAFAIAQTFFLLVGERKTELVILRAIGARRSSLRALVLVEAAMVGVAGGLLGLVVGGGAALLIDAVVVSQLPDIPFKPEHVVDLSFSLMLIAFGLGVLAALLGAFVPAARAASADPAHALRS